MKSLFAAGCLVVFSFFAGSAARAGEDPVDPQVPSQARFELRLSLLEFSVLHGAAVSGINKYGGAGDFQVKIGKEGEDLVTTVSITNSGLLDAWTFWMAQRTSEMLGVTDLDKMAPENKVALKVSQSINAKLAQTKTNPIYNPVTIEGKVVDSEGKLFLDAANGRFEVKGDRSAELLLLNGKPVLATGFHKAAKQLEVTRFVEKKEDTLELFVMSQCPYGKQAEFSVIKFLREHHKDPASRPKLEVRFLFYKDKTKEEKPDAPKAFTSLHGEKEIEENLVQIVLRESYPAIFEEYLFARSSVESPWKELAAKAGLREKDIAEIEKKIVTDRQALIEAEYACVAGSHNILDGSPSFVWEGRAVQDLLKVKAFEGFEFSSPTCGAGK